MSDGKKPESGSVVRLALVIFCSLSGAVGVLAWEPPNPGSGTLLFKTHMLYLDLNEGCAVADVDNDGFPDLIAGRNWYAGPDFVPRPLREIEESSGYLANNSEHVYDVDGDGWIDVISGSFFGSEVYWFENPGSKGLANGVLWEKHLLGNIESTQNEITFLRDLDGDDVPELIVNSWNKEAPLLAWKLGRDAAGSPWLERIVIGETGNGHGMGFGDVNGDGREDILVGTGWYERPADRIFEKSWTFHPDWEIPASCPMLMKDLDADGRNDIIWGMGHDFGLYWWQQEAADPGGQTRWKEHVIDKEFSQAHALAWADLDGDGREELITGKRRWAHNGKDPGGNDPPVLYYYKWNPTSLRFTRHVISEGDVGTGLQIRAADLNRDGRIDLAVSGKSGTYLLLNYPR